MILSGWFIIESYIECTTEYLFCTQGALLYQDCHRTSLGTVYVWLLF